MMIERRANPYPLPGSTSDVWWCTECNRVIETVDTHSKPDVCPLWACVKRRCQETSSPKPPHSHFEAKAGMNDLMKGKPIRTPKAQRRKTIRLLANLVRKQMLDQKINLEELSRRLGRPRWTSDLLARWIDGQIDMPIRTTIDVFTALGVELIFSVKPIGERV